MGNIIYVTDSKNTCVYVFNGSGQFLFSFEKKSNSKDQVERSLSSSTAIAINSEDYVHISESNIGDSIYDKEGCFVKAFGACGN